MRTRKALLASFLMLMGTLWVSSLAAQEREAASIPDPAAVADHPSGAPQAAVPDATALDAQNQQQAPPAQQSPAVLTRRPDTPPDRPPGSDEDKAPSGTAATANGAAPAGSAAPVDNQESVTPPPEPPRILGVIPNFRAVSAGSMPPPPKPGEAFRLATRNAFDYSAFIYVGFNSVLSEWDNTHSQLGKGPAGFGRYYWRGFLSRTDGSYLVLFAMPSIFHQDERYYELGRGPVWKRVIYAATRVLETPNYQGEDTFNTSLFVGRGVQQALNLAIYPSQSRTVGKFAEGYGIALGRVALTNIFREFWPDVAAWAHRRKR